MLGQAARARALSDPLPPWLSTKQAAELLGMPLPQFMNAMYGGRLTGIDVRRVGTIGMYAVGRLYRFERGSLLRLKGADDVAAEELPRWVKVRQAADYYQISKRTVPAMIAHGQLKAKRIGRQIRIERDSLMELGRVKYWGT